MSRSPYAVTSALVVACPECHAGIGQPCVKENYAYGKIEPHVQTLQRSHSARRRLADEQRTREINPKLLPPLEDEYLPMHKPLQPRMPNFCPNDHNCFPGYPCAICDGMGDV